MSVYGPAVNLGLFIVRQKCQCNIQSCLKQRSIDCRAATAMAMSRDFLPARLSPTQNLWTWQNEREETEGRKSRPSCVVIALRGDADCITHLALRVVATQPPQMT